MGGRLVVAGFTSCTTRERQRVPEQSQRLSIPPPDLRRNCFGEHVDNTSRIVAVHGLTGHWLRSWTADGSESTYFWLAQALPRSFPTARIVSCEHGGLRENTIESLLWDLLGDREASGCDQVPIVILAHSFGGTLAKQIFIASSPSRNPSEEAQKLHWHIKGFMFFGTTNAGRPSERWSFAFRSSVPWVLVPGHRADPAALIEYLEQVEAVNKDFDSCGGSRVPTVCFYETKPTRIWGWYGVRAKQRHGIPILLMCVAGHTGPQGDGSCSRSGVIPSGRRPREPGTFLDLLRSLAGSGHGVPRTACPEDDALG